MKETDKRNRSYSNEIAKLAPIETFDARAFVGQDKHDQDLCDFVVALAVAFNDLKDLLLASRLLMSKEPADTKTLTPELGAFGGAHHHLYRLMLGFVHELLTVVDEWKGVSSDPSFEAIVRRLPAGSRAAWRKLTTAAADHKTSDADTRFLMLARHKVVFHYDPRAIGKGFRRAFVAGGDREPMLSRGDSIASSRFYFADASTQSYLQEVFGENDIEQFIIRRPDLLREIGFSLHGIVTTFVNSRGYAWRQPAGTSPRDR